MTDRILLGGAAVLSAAFIWAATSAVPLQMSPRTAGLPQGASKADRQQDYNSGAFLFRTFCASCHGNTGTGDGPVADLSSPRPSNLTTLQQKAGGVFPRAHVMGVLDGSAPLRGHQGPSMPNWREALMRTEGHDTRIVEKRLDALVSHVESLQAK